MKLDGPGLRDDFVCGLDHVEIIGGGNARFVLYRIDIMEDGEEVRVPVRHIIMPLDALPDAIAKSMAILTSQTLKKFAVFLPLH